MRLDFVRMGSSLTQPPRFRTWSSQPKNLVTRQIKTQANDAIEFDRIIACDFVQRKTWHSGYPFAVAGSRSSMCVGFSNGDAVVTRADEMVAVPGSIVTLELSLTPENGFVPEPLFDRNGTVSFIVQWGNYLPGLHELVVGCRVGDSVEGIAIDAGWGERRNDLLFTVPMSKAQALWDRTLTSTGASDPSFAVGVTIQLQGGINVVVASIDYAAGTVVLDANPLLAGASYLCSFTVLAIHPIPSFIRDDPGTANSMTAPRQQKTQSGEDQGDHSSDSCGSRNSALNCHDRHQVATFALGCFWGAELAFMRTPGVVGTRVGYTQGVTLNPTYEQVCTGRTHHREAIQVVYDATVVSYVDLIQVALDRLQAVQSPLGLHRLFQEVNDEETKQYRHGFFFHCAAQHDVIKQHVSPDQQNRFSIELKPAATFWKAEDQHQQYLYKRGQSSRKGDKQTIRCYG
jgi:peptide-methionine (S)-S-oxide reductase